jgi:hypothetical protein
MYTCTSSINIHVLHISELYLQDCHNSLNVKTLHFKQSDNTVKQENKDQQEKTTVNENIPP